MGSRPISPPTTSPTSFFKIILPSTMHDHKLRIPEDFAKNHGNELSTSAMFTVRSGRVWHVGVEKSDKMLWFTNGWKEFAENNSLCCGFFLVFNYEGNSNFKVLIFDLTATEIHNDLCFSEESNQGKQCRVSNEEGRGDDNFVQILACSSRRPPVSSKRKIFDQSCDRGSTGKRCCQSLLQEMFYFAPEFALRINKCGRCLSSMESLRSNSHYLTRNKRCKMGDKGKIVELEDVTVSRRGKQKASEMSSSQRSSLDKPKKEDFIEILGCSTSRPPHFSPEKKILDQSRDRCRTGKRCCQSSLQQMFYFAPEFALRMNKWGRCLSSMESLRSNSPYLTRNKQFKMGLQRKIVELEDVTIWRRGKRKAHEISCSQRSSLNKPRKNKWNPTKKRINSLDREGHHQINNADFVQDASVRSKGEQQLKVKEEVEEEFPAGNNSGNVPTRRPVTKQEREKAVNAAMMLKPKNPHFMQILKPYSVHKFLNVPSSFAKKHLRGGSGSVELQVSGGKQWTVGCNRANGTVRYLSKGWARFVYDNHLSEGDVCVFELIQVKHVLKVSMFRAA